MDLLKALKRTTIISATALLALGATEACAGTDNVAVLGHISASVTGALNVAEISALKFGNYTSGGSAGTLTLAADGSLLHTGGVTPMFGADAPAPHGIGAGASQETGSQAPGFYSVTTEGTTTHVYVTFADNLGNIIDPVTHPSNNVILNGPDGATPSTIFVDHFTFAVDDHTTGYVPAISGTNPTPDGSYGSYITVAANTATNFRVGAELHDPGSSVTGRYVGTYYVMVSY